MDITPPNLNLPPTSPAMSAAGPAPRARTRGIQAQRPKIAIVGAGVAGLSAALDALDAGYEVHLFESQGRIGGNLISGELDGHTVERGGEIVDATHHAWMKTLAKIGIKEKPEPGDPTGTAYLVDRHREQGEAYARAGGQAPAKELEERYYIDGKAYSRKDFLDPEAPGGGSFARLHAQIVKDRESLRDAQGNWTPEAKKLDGMSMEKYLSQHAELAKDAPWVLQAITMAYQSEIGREPSEMSALNMIDFMGTDRKEFSMYSSDETYRIPGGAAEVMKRMKAKLESYGDQLQYHGRRELIGAENATAAKDSPKKLTFHNSATLKTEADTYDGVICTLPPQALLKVAGLEALGIDGPRQAALHNLQFNQGAKITVKVKDISAWALDAEGKPSGHNGEAVSNGFYQAAWPNVNRGPDGEPDGTGTVTFLIGGKAAMEPNADLVGPAMAGYAKDMGKQVGDMFDLSVKPIVNLWGQKGGCYPAPKQGAYTQLADFGRAPSNDPRVTIAGNFINCAGEDGEEIGFMNCAANSAQRGLARFQQHYPVVSHAQAVEARSRERNQERGAAGSRA